MKKVVLALMLTAMTAAAIVLPLLTPAEACQGKKKKKVAKKPVAARLT